MLASIRAFPRHPTENDFEITGQPNYCKGDDNKNIHVQLYM